MLGYCQVQDVNAGMTYSARLIITDEHNDSVVLADSFKFAAHSFKLAMHFKLTY